MPDNSRLVPTAAAPDLPTKTILVNSEVLPGTFSVLSVHTTHEAHKIPYAEIILSDGSVATEDFESSNAPELIPGNQIEIKAGYHGSEEIIFKGMIVKHGIRIVEGGTSVLYITAKHEIFKTATNPKTKVFIDASDSDVIEELIPGTKDVAASLINHEYLSQDRCTDWDFLNLRAEAANLFVFPQATQIKVCTPDLSAEPALTLYYGSSILSFDAEMDARQCFEEIQLNNWSNSNQATEDNTTSNSWSGSEPGNISTNALAQSIGQSALNVFVQGSPDASVVELMGKSIMLRKHLSKTVGNVRCTGFANIWPGDMLELNGVGERFNGKVMVSAVKQVIRKGKWETEMQFGWNQDTYANQYEDMFPRPGDQHQPTTYGLQIGIVTDLEDPNDESRIKIKMPSVLGDGEVWARLGRPDAGKDRGDFCLPELDDEVIVAFINNNTALPIVLGSLYSSNKTPPIKAKNDNYVKGYYSKNGLRHEFDDEKKTMTLDTASGNKIVLSEDNKSISIEDEHGNKILLDQNGITMESIKDFVVKATGDAKLDAMNIKMKADAQIENNASAGLKLSSSGMTEIKGSLVKIN